MLKVYQMSIRPLLDEDVFMKQLELVQKQRRAKVLRFQYKEDRCRSLAAGLLIRIGLKQEGIQYDTVQIEETERGKPYCPGHEIYFNCSHSGDFAVAAFCSQKVGIDIECMDDRFQKETRIHSIAKRAFTEEERQLLEGMAEQERAMEFLRIWTRKESYAKAAGLGLGMEFSQINTLRMGHCHTELFRDESENAYVISICTMQKEEEPVFRFTE